MNTTFVVIRNISRMCLMGVFWGLVGYHNVAAAQTPPEKVKVPEGFQSLEFEPGGENIRTKESLVTLDGTRYRKIEYQKKIFYLKLLADQAASVSEMICEDEAHKIESQRLAETQVEITARTSYFMDGLQKNCRSDHGKTTVQLTPAIRIGFLFKGNQKDVIQNKRIYIVPGLGLGGSAEF